jgi:ABC-type phosphate transport system auxiliary subunit
MTIEALNEIHEEIERASEERTEVRRRLSAEYDPNLVAELHALDARLDRLWDEQRSLRARLRFGSRESIVARARVEVRLEGAA